jgi:hypothetical protein
MANNNINLKFISEDSQLDKSLKKLGSIEGRIKKLVSAEQKGQITTQQFNKRIATLATEFQRVSGGSIAARNSLFKYSREVYQSSKATDQLADSTNRLAVASKNASSHVQVVGKRANRLGVITQQAGYQFGDFAVQVQSGTSPLIAFSQQATQLIGTFSMLATSTRAIMAFSALGVIVPVVSAIAGAFLRTREAAEESSGSVDLLTKALNASTSAAKVALTPVEDLTEQYGRFAVAVKESSRLVAQAQVTKSVGSLMGATEEMRGGLSGFMIDLGIFNRELEKHAEVAEVLGERTVHNKSKFEDMDQAVMAASDAVNASAKAMGLSSLQAQTLNRAFKTLESAKGPEAIAEAAKRAQDFLSGVFSTTEEIPDSIADMVVQLDLVLKAAASSAGVMEDISNIDMTTNISSAATAAGKLAENLRVARGYRLDKLVGGNVDFFDPRGEAGTSGVITRDRENPQGNRPRKTEVSQTGSVARNALLDLQKRIALDTKLLGVSREQAQVERAIANSKIKYSPKEIANTVKELEVYNLKISKMKETQALYGTMQSSLESGFMAMVDGTKSVEDAFKDMAKQVIAELYRILVVKRMVGDFESGTGIMGMIGGFFGGGSAPTSSIRPQMRPSSFDGGGYTGSGPRSGGMDGRGGYMAMLHPRETVIDHTKAGSAGGGESVTIVNNFNFQANGDDSVKRIIAQAAPSIANMAKQSVMDSRRRGGAMKNTFG